MTKEVSKEEQFEEKTAPVAHVIQAPHGKDGKTRTYGPFDSAEDAASYLNHKRSRGTQNWDAGVKVLTAKEAARRREEEAVAATIAAEQAAGL